MDFTPSKYQEAIFEEVQNGNENIVVNAVAGSGKTTTIVESLNVMPKDKDIAFVAFNSHIAKTLASKAPKYVDVMTLHSMGFKAIKAMYGRKKVQNSKMFQIVKDLNQDIYKNYPFEEKKKVTPVVMKLVGLLKGSLLEPTEENIDVLAAKHNIQFPDKVPVYDMIAKAFEESKDIRRGVDFDDMIWMPNYMELPCEKYDIIVVDETQDLNPAQVELIIRSLDENGRVIAIGDSCQSLYGFRGADTEAMPKLIERLNAKVMPLSISYRCPASHIRLAQTIVPQIEAATDAIEGEIHEICEDDLMDYVSPNDLCLCRYNAPLVRPAFDLLSQGIKVCIRGKDIGSGLVKLIKGFGTNNISEMEKKLDMWVEREYAKARDKGMNTDPITDKANTIFAFIDMANARNVTDLINHISEIFDDGRAQVTFSSVHRAKGLEADNVFILKPSAMPSRHAKQEWEKVQEKNIQYVAFTRAKKCLYMVE